MLADPLPLRETLVNESFSENDLFVPFYQDEMTSNSIWPVSMVKLCYCKKAFRCTAAPSAGYSTELQDKHLCLYWRKWLNTEEV